MKDKIKSHGTIHFIEGSENAYIMWIGNKFYIGKTSDPVKRSEAHHNLMKRGAAASALQSAYDEFIASGGIASDIVETYYPDETEQSLLDKLGLHEDCLNAIMHSNTARGIRYKGVPVLIRFKGVEVVYPSTALAAKELKTTKTYLEHMLKGTSRNPQTIGHLSGLWIELA